MEEKLPQRKHTRLAEYDYSNPGYYFVTICSARRTPFFARIAGGKTCLTPIGIIAEACLVDIPEHIQGASIDIYCVMPDHIHMIVVIESVGPPYMAADRSKQTLSRIIQQYKSAVTRISHQQGLWQSGFYDHILRNDADLAETRRYITENPAATFERSVHL